MKTTKLFSRFMTLFLLMLFGFAVGAKSAGLSSYHFAMLLAMIGGISFLHFTFMRKKFT